MYDHVVHQEISKTIEGDPKSDGSHPVSAFCSPNMISSQLGMANMRKNASFFQTNRAGVGDGLHEGTKENHASHTGV